MSGLLYRQDMDAVRARLRTWWDGGDIGGPVMQVTAPGAPVLEDIPRMPEPAGWITHYSTSNFAYRVNLSQRTGIGTHYLGEAVPVTSPDLGPGCLSLYLGCRGVDSPGTVWFEPCMSRPEDARFEYDPKNFYWDFTLRLAREQLRIGRGKFLLQFPDLIEGLDTLAAMRGTQELLEDLIERPDWVHSCLRQITDRYFHYYDILYNLIRDEIGGSVFWSYAPGRMAKFQCDFSAMISPDMFGEFMVPVLREMCQRVSYCIYHWDGPGAIPHHNHLLSIPDLKAIQWTPGSGVDREWHPRWWPMYHKTLDAGKGLWLGVYGATIDDLRALRKEFGHQLNRFVLVTRAETLAQAQEMIKVVSD